MFKIFMMCFMNRSPEVTRYVERHVGTNPPGKTPTRIIRNDYLLLARWRIVCQRSTETAKAGEVGICGQPGLGGDKHLWKDNGTLSPKQVRFNILLFRTFFSWLFVNRVKEDLNRLSRASRAQPRTGPLSVRVQP